MVARHQRNTGVSHDRFSRRLRAHSQNSLNRWTYESNIVGGALTTKLRVLRQKTITGVYCLGATIYRCLNQFVDNQVGFIGGSRANVYRFIGHFHMKRSAVCIAVNNHSCYTHSACSFNDSASDFAAIGDQYLTKHKLR